MVGAVSPAVLSAAMRPLYIEGYVQEKGIHSLLLAAGSVDEVIAIVFFGLCLGIGFTDDDLEYGAWISEEIWGGLVMISIEIFAGLLVGGMIGIILSLLEEFTTFFRFLLSLGAALGLVFSASTA
mmetsp:Transcript_37535/g.6750  ORF Transcript_37535/g.6750 Transcript_37535/m.6750 type:complete len:125 (-) Transcript_37535:684-1058(-)